MKTGTIGIIIMIIVASLVVLFIMNPNGFSSMISSIGGQAKGESTILTGSGYRSVS